VCNPHCSWSACQKCVFPQSHIFIHFQLRLFWDLRTSWMLHSVNWWLVTKPKTSVTTNLHCVTFQKNEDRIYIMVEARYLAWDLQFWSYSFKLWQTIVVIFYFWEWNWGGGGVLPWYVFSIEIDGRNSGNFCDGYEFTMQIKVLVSKYIHHLLNFMSL
jgi:hypothetical protein